MDLARPRFLDRGAPLALGVLALAMVLVPLSPQALLADPVPGWQGATPSAYGKAVADQLYILIRTLVLWGPVGLLFAFADKAPQARRWAAAAALAFIVGLALLHRILRVQDAIEVLAGYWGVWLGAWLGVRLQAAPAVEARAHASIRLPRYAAVLALAGALVWAALFPRWGSALAVSLVVYAWVLWRWRHAWLLVVPAALPLLNLAPGTGRFYFDEFDLMIIVTLAMALWHGAVAQPRPKLARGVKMGLGLFGTSVLVSLLIGLFPLTALDANAFSSYWSHYNALRVAKAFAWALALLALLRWTIPVGQGLPLRLAVPGMWLGLAGVVLAGLWERWRFAGLTDLGVPYRITATFSSMHTGGSEIETYLVITIPFLWLAFTRERPAALKAAVLLLVAVAAFLMTLTIARAGVAALAAALGILAIGAWRARAAKDGRGVTVIGLAALLLAAGALAVGLGGAYLQKRLAQTEEDWGIRTSHWASALEMRDRDWRTALFGMGLGRFPETYLFRSLAASRPGTYRYMRESGQSFLRLAGGESLYVAQRVDLRGGERYLLSLRARSAKGKVQLHVPLCERQLLDSLRCQWRSLTPPPDGRWHEWSVAIEAGGLGAGNILTRRPVELTLYNGGAGAFVDVTDVQLRDERGHNLIRNGNFAAGSDYWFFKTHDHLPWHIKNIWVELLFDQGWFGLAAFAWLLVAVLALLGRAMWRGDPHAGVLLASLAGLLVIGVFGSLFDTPRLALLFYLLVLIAGASGFFTVASRDNPNKSVTH